MATRAQRWRGPRRPDVQELRATSQQQDQPDQTQRAGAAAAAAPSSHDLGSPAVSHFKFGFLSAGVSTMPDSGLHRRPGIMDATRTFESNGEPQDNSQEAKYTRALAQAQRERYAEGMGYGSTHRNHSNYLSNCLPPRAVESPFDERPCVYPTVPMPPRPTRPTHPEQMPFEDQMEYSRPFRTRVASGLGVGPKQPEGNAYLANPYWRK